MLCLLEGNVRQPSQCPQYTDCHHIISPKHILCDEIIRIIIKNLYAKSISRKRLIAFD